MNNVNAAIIISLLTSILGAITYFGYLSIGITAKVLDLIGHLFFLN